jgi:organic hydroperoxide reductase OsmC/OhrA
MKRTHNYHTTIRWTGNTGSGTTSYNSYDRSHNIESENKPVILASSDPLFRGDKSKYNPEELFVCSISSCHMLWYLHLCADAGVIVTNYLDNAIGVMNETPDGGGHFTEIILNPSVTVTEQNMIQKAKILHHRANALCFIANSINFPVHHNPEIMVKD